MSKVRPVLPLTWQLWVKAAPSLELTEPNPKLAKETVDRILGPVTAFF